MRRLRKARGLSQPALAKLADIDQSVVSRLESGKGANPLYETVLKLAGALRVSVEELRPSAERASQDGPAGGFTDDQPSVIERPPWEAIFDPRLRLAFYDIAATWDELDVEDQEDILATVAHRLDVLKARGRGRDVGGGEPGAGAP